MSISMYQASLPVLIRGLTNLQHILGKAQAHAAEKQIDPSVFIGARLYPDMLPLVRQVYIATDTAKGCAARLAGVDIPSFPDVEQNVRRAACADPEDDRLSEALRCRADRRHRVAPDRAEDARRPDRVHRAVVPAEFRAAQLLLPRDNRVRHPAPQRRRTRQARLSRRPPRQRVTRTGRDRRTRAPAPEAATARRSVRAAARVRGTAFACAPGRARPVPAETPSGWRKIRTFLFLAPL